MSLLALTLCAVLAPIQKSVIIETTLRNDDTYTTIKASEFPIRQLMESLCRKSGLELHGFEDLEGTPLVTVYLENRPLNVAVEYVLGAAGLVGSLGAKRLDVRASSQPFATQRDALQLAEIAYLSALQRFPSGEDAAAARLALADIALLRGEREKAVRHYELLVDQETDLATQLKARMRAGNLLVELRDWSKAAPHFRLVAESENDRATIIEARRQLARCVLMRGEPQQALYMIQALDAVYEPLSESDHADRLMISARAMINLGDYIKGLAALDKAQSISKGAISEFEGMDLRARAMELDGRPADAATGWVQYSRNKSVEEKTRALVRAAEMALSAGEDVAVLFIWKHASKEGVGDALLPQVNEARARLGLDGESYSNGTLTIRLNRALQLVDAAMLDQAAQVFASIHPELTSLGATDRVRFATAYSSILEGSAGVDQAIDLLRETVRTLESIQNRSKLYLLAGGIYERHHQFDEAAAAYGGEL